MRIRTPARTGYGVGISRVSLYEQPVPSMVSLKDISVTMSASIAGTHLYKVSIFPPSEGAFDNPTILSLLTEISPAKTHSRERFVRKTLGGACYAQTLYEQS